MVFESPHLRVTLEYGTATLWLGFPGDPVNALDLSRLCELDAAVAAVAANRAVRVLVVRSAKPAGFCAGLRPGVVESLPHPTQRANFAWYGQQVLDRLAALDAVTVAYLDGPCLGAGLELALACDHRVCVARPTTHLGFPEKFACFGGTARLRALIGRRAAGLIATGETLSGREGRVLGLVDVACCERRGKIELRTFLDRVESRPVKSVRPELVGLADERRAFAVRVGEGEMGRRGENTPAMSSSPCLRVSPSPALPLPSLPTTIGLLGDDPNAARIAAEAVLRGGSAVVCGDRAPLFAYLDTALKRGFVTPLEAEQAKLRVRGSDTLDGFDRAGLVFVAEGHDPFRLAAVVRPRAVVCVIRPNLAARPNTHPPVPFPHMRRVLRISFGDPGRVGLFPGHGTAADTTAAVAAWLAPFGLTATTFPAAARLLPRAA
ncbi:enoyl-CoA hydratase/isomerase family protein [Gemmata sp.]|uniref:enoyl-CoA hydratase/isomerase family protein n=1 Tax=Gemmata sp. TaxID=1914242 RepID=UPI003F702E6E